MAALPRQKYSRIMTVASPELLLRLEPGGGGRMRRLSMATRDELLAAAGERYRVSTRADKSRIVDEFAAATGYHRKHAMRVLRTGRTNKRAAPRPSRRIYGAAEREALIVLWEASDRVCGKRLKAIIPGAVHWPRFLRNRSEQFEARLVLAEVIGSKSVLFAEMAGLQAPLVIAHGEGRAEFNQASHDVCLRFVDNHGRPARHYPHNPNGSPEGVAGVTSDDGRVTILMPHPERVYLRAQFSWLSPEWRAQESPWFGLFANARRFVT